MTFNTNPKSETVRPGLEGQPREVALAVDSVPRARAGLDRRTVLQRGLEIAISLICLYFALRAVRPAELWVALRGADLVWLLIFIVTMPLVLALKAWRWQLLFLPEYHPPYGSIFSIFSFSYMLTNVLPGRAGELARVVLLPAEQPVSAARTVATIVVERLLDLLSVLALLVVLLPFVQLPVDLTRAAQALGVLALLGAAGMILLSFWKTALLRLAHRLLSHVHLLDRPAVYAALEHLLDGFALLRTPLGLAVIGLALISWVGVVALAWEAAMVFRLPVPLTAAAFAVVVTSLSMLLPSTPGYVGVFQLAAKMALLPLGVPVAVAEIYAFGWWALEYITITLTGLVAMWVHGISFRQVMNWNARRKASGAQGELS